MINVRFQPSAPLISLISSPRMKEFSLKSHGANRSTVNRRGPLWGGCSRSGTLCELLASRNHTRFGMKVSASCNYYSCRPAAFCQRLLCVSLTLRACCHRQTESFPEKRACFREPASSVDERSFPARPGTGGTESTQTMGKVAAEMCTVTGTTMPAERLRPATVIHHFPRHAAPPGAVPLLNAAKSG